MIEWLRNNDYTEALSFPLDVLYADFLVYIIIL